MLKTETQKQTRKTTNNETEARNQKKTTNKDEKEGRKTRETEQDYVKEGGGKRGRGGYSGERKGDTQKHTKMPIFMGNNFL